MAKAKLQPPSGSNPPPFHILPAQECSFSPAACLPNAPVLPSTILPVPAVIVSGSAAGLHTGHLAPVMSYSSFATLGAGTGIAVSAHSMVKIAL